jgi:hypothetical protein
MQRRHHRGMPVIVRRGCECGSTIDAATMRTLGNRMPLRRAVASGCMASGAAREKRPRLRDAHESTQVLRQIERALDVAARYARLGVDMLNVARRKESVNGRSSVALR